MLIAFFGGLFNRGGGRKPCPRDFLHCWQGEAIAQTNLYPHQRGRVKFGGTVWFAQCKDQGMVTAGTVVRVVGRTQVTLWVELLPEEPESA
ncbi:MAG: hypothetical protein EA366_09845 [Spirulina sp. DLM2.Bin59]|nr:MAG: hypothetical protein EA366_09845 [Spirulina sp. DLM2.Bin59]